MSSSNTLQQQQQQLERPTTPTRATHELVDTNGELSQPAQYGYNQDSPNVHQQQQQPYHHVGHGYPQQETYSSPQMQYIQNPNTMPKYPKAPMQFSPQKMQQNHYLFQQLPLHRAPWNERFYLSSVQNNAKSHPFYKEYFDKPTRQNNEAMLKPTKPDVPIEEFYRSSSLAQLLYDSLKHKRPVMRREITKTNLRDSLERQGRPYTMQMGRESNFSHGKRSKSSHNLMVQEFNWIDKFNVMQSKNNVRVHDNFREYFDRPIEYDQRGYLYSAKKEPMQVYEQQTPILETLKATKSSKFLTRTLQSSDGARRLIKTSQSNMRSTGNLKQTLRASTGSNFHQTTSTRSSMDKKMRNTWNQRIGLPISTYNEKVFPKYKILFEDL